MTIRSELADTLDQGELVLWQGHPDSTMVWYTMHYLSLLLGLAVCGFAVIWMTGAAQDGGWGWTLGLPILIIGIITAFGLPYGAPYLSRRTSYTLTNKRALITIDLPILGRKTKFYPITSESPVELEERNWSSVFFATKKERNTRGSYIVKIGFQRIDDANHVFELISEIQKKTA